MRGWQKNVSFSSVKGLIPSCLLSIDHRLSFWSFPGRALHVLSPAERSGLPCLHDAGEFVVCQLGTNIACEEPGQFVADIPIILVCSPALPAYVARRAHSFIHARVVSGYLAAFHSSPSKNLSSTRLLLTIDLIASFTAIT